MSIELIFALLLVTLAAGCDLRNHRIPNVLTYPACLIGLALGFFTGGVTGLMSSTLGFLSCFIPMLILFIGGSLGGGDVKLMGAVGALLGFPAGLNALISSILVGGFLAAIILLWQGRLYALARYCILRVWCIASRGSAPEPPPQYKDGFPFGVAIALGTYLTIASMVTGQVTPANVFPQHMLPF